MNLVRLAADLRKLAFGITDFEKMMKYPGSFGVVTAYRAELPKSENKKRQGLLIADIQRMGLKVLAHWNSSWEDFATNVTHKEGSLIVGKISFAALINLSDKYEQDAVVYKDPSGTIGIYDKRGNATLAYDSKGLAAVDVSKERGEYSKGRSMSFGLKLVDKPIPYHNRPVTLQDLQKVLGS